MSRYMIPVTVISLKKWLYTLSLLRAQNMLTFRLSWTCTKETRGFSLPQILQLWYWPYHSHETCSRQWKLQSPEISHHLISDETSTALSVEVTLDHNSPTLYSVCFATWRQAKTLYRSSD
jgi:hypothetical protein